MTELYADDAAGASASGPGPHGRVSSAAVVSRAQARKLVGAPACETACETAAALVPLLVPAGRQVLLATRPWSMEEEDVRRILSYPGAMFGSDGLPHDEFPHPRLWGTFPRILGHYARDVGLFPLEDAVRRMTSISAEQFGLVDRGTIAPGKFADLCVFDPDTIIDSASFDDPMTPAAGIGHVLVNGREVWGQSGSTGARPGRALRKGG